MNLQDEFVDLIESASHSKLLEALDLIKMYIGITRSTQLHANALLDEYILDALTSCFYGTNEIVAIFLIDYELLFGDFARICVGETRIRS